MDVEEVVSSLNETAKSFGGEVEYFSSERELNDSEKTQYSSDLENFEQITQIIKVMTTPTGKKEFGNYVASRPISNAIVRINGIPRYTDRNGEIKVTVDGGYAELFVEKTGYNPYIEIFEFTGEDKIIYLKQPKDDIYFEYAMFNYCGDVSNVLIQDSYFSLGDEYYYALLDVKTNILADEYRLYCDGNLVRSENNGSFTILNFEDFCKIDSVFSIQVVYQGIESEKVDLNIHVLKQIEQKDICDPNDISVDSELDGVDNQKLRMTDSGITPFGNFELDLADALKRLFEVYDGRGSAELNFIVDRKKGTLKMLIGYSYAVKRTGIDGIEDKIDAKNKKLDKTEDKEQRKKLESEIVDLVDQKEKLHMEDWHSFAPIYHNVRIATEQAKRGERSLKSLKSELSNLKQLSKKGPAIKNMLQKVPGFTVDFSVIGTVEFSFKEEKFVDVNVALELEGRVEWKQQFVVVSVPVFLRVGAGLKFTMKFTFVDEYEEGQYGFKVEDFFTFTVKLFLWAEIGVGFCDLLSVSLRGEGGVEFVFKTKSDFLQINGEAALSLRIKALLWEFNIDLVSRRWEDIGRSYDEMKLARTNFINENENLSDFKFMSNIYDVSQPQLTKFGDKQLLTWIEYSNDRDIYNSTVLMYSLFENGNWTQARPIYDTGKADFDYDVYCDLDGDVHIAWQTSNRIFSSSDSLESMAKESEIYIADISKNGEVNNVQKLTSNHELDCAPRFVKQETAQDPVSLIWRKNSLNDILGFNGINEFVSSNNLDWHTTTEIVSFNQFVSFGDCAYTNGELNAAFILDEDGDLATNDYEIYLVNSAGVNNITNDPTDYSSINYVDYEGKLVLQFKKDSNLFNYIDENVVKAMDISYNTVNTVTMIENETAGVKLVYYTMKLDNVQQLYCSLYDESLNLWSENIALTEEKFDVTKASVVINDDGSLDIAYFVSDFESNLTVLCYNTKDFCYDIEIEEAYISENIQIGQDFTINLSLLNAGDLPITNIKLLVGEKEEEIILNKPLKSGESTYLETSYKINNFDEEKLTLKACYKDIYSEYVLNLKKVDYELSVDKIINSGKQIFNINVKQLSDVSSDFVLKIRINGKEVYSKEIFSQEGLILSYMCDNIKDGDLLVFELIPNASEFDWTNNKVRIFSTQTEIETHKFENVYSNVINHAKEVLI